MSAMLICTSPGCNAGQVLGRVLPLQCSQLTISRMVKSLMDVVRDEEVDGAVVESWVEGARPSPSHTAMHTPTSATPAAPSTRLRMRSSAAESYKVPWAREEWGWSLASPGSG